MQAIYKYPLALDDWSTVQMPHGSRVLTVQVQNGMPFVWALVDPLNHKRSYRFRTLGTGHPASDAIGSHYMGTYQLSDGALVFHVFLVGEQQ